MDRQVSLRDVIERAGDGTDPLSEAASIAEHLLRLADRLLDHFVDQARRAGLPWAAIGARLGVSRQAAQKRFAARGVGQAAATSRREGEGS